MTWPPRGKQDWQLEPHATWYPRTTGIWQRVWLERVPATRIESIRWTAVTDQQERYWAYSHCADPARCAERFTELLSTVRSLELLAGFCYTQLADTYQDALLLADRTPKISLERIAQAVNGSRPEAQGGTLSPRHSSIRATRQRGGPVR